MNERQKLKVKGATGL